MKTILAILFICLCFGSHAQSYEKEIADTINLTDAAGKKQGKWILHGYHKPGSGYESHQIIEQGFYKENKRTGLWKEYYKNGNLKSAIHYVNGKPEGKTLLYFENGNLREEGTWKNNRWTGKYKIYNEDGSVYGEFVFDDKGKEISKKITAPQKKKKQLCHHAQP